MPVGLLLTALLGAALLAAAASKIADRTGTAIAATSFGVGGAAARWAWLPLAVLEASLAAGVLAGSRPAAWAAAALLATFTAAQAIAIAAGRGGAPCGCFGASGRISWAGAGRAAALAATALAAGLAADDDVTTAAHAAAGITALALAAVVVARGRRAATPAAALEVASEGPALGTRIELAELPEGGVRLAFFGAENCRLCRALRPQAARLGATVYDERADRAQWAAAAVPGAPFAVALGADGTVLAKGTVNTGRQLESILAVARERAVDGDGSRGSLAVARERAAAADGDGERAGLAASRAAPQRPDAGNSRRSFLATASAGVAAITAGRMVGSLVAPGDADAFHFCGHIYTTDGCPHPTGLPRIDSRGYPLRARDGREVDDLGRLIDAQGVPVGEDGSLLLDADGRPQRPATRTRVCAAAARRFRISTTTDGAWYRCCDGHVRKLIDCCTPSAQRINGDRALRGYCFKKRHVFCVMYLQTRVPC